MAYFFSLLIIASFFLGCSDTTDSQTNQEPFSINFASSKAPTLDTVPVDAALLLQVTAEIDETSLTTSSVYIQDNLNQQVPATLSLDGNIITVRPIVYLQANSSFSLIVTTALLNTQGQHLSTNVSFNFNSGGPTADTTGPVITAQNFGVSSIEPYSILYYQFNEPISPLTIDNTIVAVYPADPADGVTTQITGQISVSGALLIFTPDAPFKTVADGSSLGYDINITLDPRIQDLSGNPVISSIKTTNVTSDANIPLITAEVNTSIYETNATVYALEAFDSTLYIGSNRGLDIVDFNATSATFTPLSHISDQEIGTVYSIDVNTTTSSLYLGTSRGFYIGSIYIKQNPDITNYYPSAPIYGLDTNATRAFLAATSDGVIELDITDTRHLIQVQKIQTKGFAFDVSFVNSQFMVAEHNESVQVYDINGTNQNRLLEFGQAKQMVPKPESGDQHLIAMGTSGVIQWGPIDSTPIYAQTFASYVQKIIVGDRNVSYANVADIGIVQIDLNTYTPTKYYTLPTSITTLSYISDLTSSNEYLIIADKNGTLSSTKVQP